MKLINLTKKYQGKYLTYYEARYINLDGKYKDYEFISRNSNLTMETFFKSYSSRCWYDNFFFR